MKMPLVFHKFEMFFIAPPQPQYCSCIMVRVVVVQKYAWGSEVRKYLLAIILRLLCIIFIVVCIFL